MRRFPPPWMIEEYNNACFIVRDATGAGARLFLFRGGAWPKIGGQAAHTRRGSADGGELRQAAGTAAPIKTGAVERNRIGAALLILAA